MAGTSSNRPLILVAHSDAEVGSRITNMLRDVEFDTVTADNGRQTLELLRQDLVQLAVLDAELPQQSALEVLRAVGAEDISIPIIVCSESTVVADAVKAMRSGAFHFFNYPLQCTEFLSSVREAVCKPSKSALPATQIGRQDTMGRFAAKIAHDFNNFLTVILNCSAMLKTDDAFDYPGSALLVDEVYQAADRAKEFTAQLLAFAKNKRQDMQKIVLDETIRSLQKMIQRLAGPNIELEYQLNAGREQIFARESQIQQVIINLAVNARDATADGGIVHICSNIEKVDSTANVRPGRYVALRVEDNGVGMSPETLANVFEPFFTTKPPDRGTGLGLNIVQEIMADHGGLISVDSQLGRGTSMTLMFPIYTSSSSAASTTPDRNLIRSG